ncbi:urotensin-2 [Ascaphus truei]|uniref:urotensin-2 n=1 Tax=Ascaphus truei TaxID=8439 RepID=UPI003F5AD573
MNWFCIWGKPVSERSWLSLEARLELHSMNLKMNLGEQSSLDQTYLLQNLPAFLGKHNLGGDTNDIFSKEGPNPGNDNMWDSNNEVFYGKHPRISLLSRLQSKDRKEYKKRGGNLSECFWKYCV